MLAKANRITSADDYRVIVRRGAKVAGAHTVSYVRSRESGTDARFGFIVSKKVGTAVRRNLVRRRLKAACADAVANGTTGLDVVVRALPSAADADWQTLQADVVAAIAARGIRPRRDAGVRGVPTDVLAPTAAAAAAAGAAHSAGSNDSVSVGVVESKGRHRA
ncbi:ribonuclease P protein component [Agromyces sp. ISL-38]|uniref:ribonuclease P protein component n=1 Tax=Agromyces sp. ISL-38 TaxID=2819107 RepID=UPI001BECBFAB|nr:ribonuclease P protein component [Agromyces sp. ISL-38]MBT2497771.1 ribonuclease P protein component [Agromyces sp. ISL-38]